MIAAITKELVTRSRMLLAYDFFLFVSGPHIGFNFCTGGTKGGFGLFNGFLIAIKQCDGSTSFDEGCCCRSPDPVAAARDDRLPPLKAKNVQASNCLFLLFPRSGFFHSQDACQGRDQSTKTLPILWRLVNSPPASTLYLLRTLSHK
jgi:hypothetical protein